jgi:hypothetical protein
MRTDPRIGSEGGAVLRVYKRERGANENYDDTRKQSLRIAAYELLRWSGEHGM